MTSDHNKRSLLHDEPIDPTSEERKLDHIQLAMKSRIDSVNIDHRFYYEPLLSGHPESKNKSFEFLDKKFLHPIWVSSMTGGTKYAKTINVNLAKVCDQFGLGMGLGSCRSLLYDDASFEDFDVRSYIGNRALYANLGIAQIEQLIQDKQTEKINELVKKLQADGLIIHVNPLQEWLQPEGDKIIHPPIDTIKIIIDQLNIPIIVKEVGQGMGYKSLKALFELPLAAIDFAANGGTNFSKLEMSRSSEEIQASFMKIANLGHDADEMVELSNVIIDELGEKCLCKQIIVSGGVKDFLDGYYYTEKLKLPAIYGQASAFLKYAKEDYDQLVEYVQSQISGLQLAQAYLRLKVS